MGVLGIGMGLVVSQLGNVVQSAVGDRDRSEAGGLQFTAQQLGSSLGTAFLGAVVITGLIAAFSTNVAIDPKISESVQQQVEALSSGGLRPASIRSGPASRPASTRRRRTRWSRLRRRAAQCVEDGLLFAALIVLASFWAARKLPTELFEEIEAAREPLVVLPRPMPEAVVLDLDGVLPDSEQLWNEAEEAVAREEGGRWRSRRRRR